MRLKKIFNYEGKSRIDKSSREFAFFSIDELIDKVFDEKSKQTCHHNDFAFYGSGWQSWGFGGEIDKGKFQKNYIPIVPQWKKYFSFPGEPPKDIFGGKRHSSKLLEGFFIIYFRWQSKYLVIASVGNTDPERTLPPTRFLVDRETRLISAQIYSDGKTWRDGDELAELEIFSADGFFNLKEQIADIYGDCFSQISESLGNTNEKIGGWESWYNHYANIDEKIIGNDIEGLNLTNNIIKREFIDKGEPTVFQVDDGWEISLGDWEARKDTFPNGMRELAKRISMKGLIPGLWLAPLIVDWRSEFARTHRSWILCGKDGKPMNAGLNPMWGGMFGKNQPSLPYSYFALDLSLESVRKHIDNLMEKVINEWGFRYIKLDFLFAGLLNGKFKNGGSAYEWYAKTLNILTKRKMNKDGKSVTYLGCGLVLESSFRRLPLSRIGPDTREDWDVNWLKKANFPSRTSAFANLQSTIGHAFWDKSVFANDPDVVFLRYTNISLTDKEKILIALVNFLFASQIMHSDDPVNFSQEKEGDFTSRISRLYDLLKNEEFGLRNNDSKSYYIFSRSKKFVGFINLGDKKISIDCREIDYMNKLKPIVSYAKIKNAVMKFEPHSISIFEI